MNYTHSRPGILTSKPFPAEADYLDAKRVNKHHFQLALAAYSFRDHFRFMKGKPQTPKGKSIDMFQFIDYCAEHSVAGAELTSYFFPPDADETYFQKIRRHAFRNGVSISGTAIGNNFTTGNELRQIKEIADAKKWIRHAAEMGAPHIRFFAGTAKDLARDPDNLNRAITALQDCCHFAAKHNVFIGVENHGQLTAEQVIRIVNEVDHDWFGISLDSGNFQTDTPYKDIQACVSRAVNVQVKVKMKKPDGEKYEADLNRVGQILKDANYRGYVALEYEESAAFDNVPDSLNQLRQALI